MKFTVFTIFFSLTFSLGVYASTEDPIKSFRCIKELVTEVDHNYISGREEDGLPLSRQYTQFALKQGDKRIDTYQNFNDCFSQFKCDQCRNSNGTSEFIISGRLLKEPVSYFSKDPNDLNCDIFLAHRLHSDKVKKVKIEIERETYYNPDWENDYDRH